MTALVWAADTYVTLKTGQGTAAFAAAAISAGVQAGSSSRFFTFDRLSIVCSAIKMNFPTSGGVTMTVSGSGFGVARGIEMRMEGTACTGRGAFFSLSLFL